MVSQGCSVTALKCYSVTVLQCLSLTGQHDVVISRFNLDNKYIYKCSVSTDIYNIFIFMIKKYVLRLLIRCLVVVPDAVFTGS